MKHRPNPNQYPIYSPVFYSFVVLTISQKNRQIQHFECAVIHQTEVIAQRMADAEDIQQSREGKLVTQLRRYEAHMSLLQTQLTEKEDENEVLRSECALTAPFIGDDTPHVDDRAERELKDAAGSRDLNEAMEVEELSMKFEVANQTILEQSETISKQRGTIEQLVTDVKMLDRRVVGLQAIVDIGENESSALRAQYNTSLRNLEASNEKCLAVEKQLVEEMEKVAIEETEKAAFESLYESSLIQVSLR